jgi:hypothetical protein
VTRTLFLLARPGVFIGAVILGCTLPPGATTAAGRQQPAAIDLGAVPSQARDRAETRHLTLRTSTVPELDALATTILSSVVDEFRVSEDGFVLVKRAVESAAAR